MKKNIILIIGLFIIIITACIRRTAPRFFNEFNPDNVEKQRFEVVIGADTLIKTKGGTFVQIQSNTFKGTSEATVNLIIQEALNRSEMLKSGLSTIDESGHILASEGMIRITAESQVAINPDAPILIHLPAKGLNTKSKVYMFEESADIGKWAYYAHLSNANLLENIATGAKLFDQYCSMCHAKNMVDKLTGPPLGCIEGGKANRSRSWLLRFTKNSQKMISLKDSLAVCNWEFWKPLLMPNFEYLNNHEIDQIYDFIKNESQRKSLCSKENFDGRPNLSDCYSIHFDSLMKLPVIDTFSYYFFPIKNFQWFSCSFFVEAGLKTKVEPIKVMIEQNASVFIIFDRYNTYIELWKEGDSYSIFSPLEHNLPLPINEPITIFAFTANKEGKRQYVEYHTKIKKSDNIIKITLSEISESSFQQILRRGI
jgi:hypothetical protein